MARQIGIYCLLMILLSSLSYGIIEYSNNFNNSLSSEIINFTTDSPNVTRYITISNYTFLHNITLSLSSIKSRTRKNYTSSQTNYTYIQNHTGNEGYLRNITEYIANSSYFYINGGGWTASVVYNISLTNIDVLINRYSISTCNQPLNYTLKVFNYSSSAWDTLENAQLPASTCNINTTNVSVDYINNGIVTVNSTFQQRNCVTNTAPVCDGKAPFGNEATNFINYSWFYGKLNYNVKSPYLEVGEPDSNPEWSISGLMTGDFNITLNNTLINNYLSSSCNCTGCVKETNFECRVPFTFNSNTSVSIGALQYSSINTTYEWGIDSCTDFDLRTLNVTFLNLYDKSKSNLDFETSLEFWSDPNIVRNFSTLGTSTNNYSLCIYPNWTTIQSDMLIQYNNGSGLFEYSTFNTTLDNQTKNWSLFVEGGTTQVTFTVTDLSGDPIQNAYISVLKYDVGTGSYNTIEILRTDGDGRTIGNIILINAFYRFIVEYKGEVKLIEPDSGGVRVLSTTKNFQISLAGVRWFDNYDIVNNIGYSLKYNNATRYFTFTWNDPNMDMHQGCLRIIQRNRTRDRTVTDTCVTSASSSITYQVINITAGNSNIATAYFKFDQENIVAQIINSIAESFKFSAKGQAVSLFFAFIVILGLVLVGLPSPVISFTLMMIGFIVSLILGLYQIGLGLVAGIFVLMFILILKSRSS